MKVLAMKRLTVFGRKYLVIKYSMIVKVPKPKKTSPTQKNGTSCGMPVCRDLEVKAALGAEGKADLTRAMVARLRARLCA